MMLYGSETDRNKTENVFQPIRGMCMRVWSRIYSLAVTA